MARQKNQHGRPWSNKILPGRKIYVINNLPKFFRYQVLSSSTAQDRQGHGGGFQGNIVVALEMFALFQSLVSTLVLQSEDCFFVRNGEQQPVPVYIIA